MNGMWWKTGAFAGLLALSACGDAPNEPTDEPTTEDGVVKPVDGKSDRWDFRNSPGRLQTQFEYLFENLPLEGAVDDVPWAETYWPYYQDGINARWQGKDVLSPAEKYDKAFKDWTPPDNFMELRPWSSSTCEFDQEYYDALGPVAKWTDRNKGNWRAHNGIDDDADGVEDKDECGFGENKDYDGVETWWGICHAWAPAAMMEKEPLQPVERNGVTFEVSDLKGLLISQYDRTDAFMVGGRCNEKELERDEEGRLKRSECRDLNAGSWHVIVTNLIGKDKRPFVIERTTNYEIWNQPFAGYRITEQREITLDEAHGLLNVDPLTDGGTGELVHGVEQGTLLADAILKFVNTASLEEIDGAAGLHATAANNIVRDRPAKDLKELDAIPFVSASAFGQLKSYVLEKDLVEKPGYKFNDDAVRFVEVRMTTDWVTESHASTNPTGPTISRYVRNDHYHYILELDADGKILGGEWLGSSIERHPDFIWLPTRPRSGNPHIDIDLVRELIAESRADVDGGDTDDDTVGTKTFTNTDRAEIPDNDPNGVTSVLSVADGGRIKTLKLDLEIRHTYRGDLFVQLAHGGVVVTVYDGRDAASPWDDDVILSGQQVDGFLAAPLEGEWELKVFDSAGADVGSVAKWALHAEVD